MVLDRVALVCGSLALVSMAFGQGVEVSSPRISIAYNSQLQRRIEWKGPNGGNIVAFDSSAQEGVVVSGLEMNAFRLDPAKTALKRVVDPEFGPGSGGHHRGEARQRIQNRRRRRRIPTGAHRPRAAARQVPRRRHLSEHLPEPRRTARCTWTGSTASACFSTARWPNPGSRPTPWLPSRAAPTGGAPNMTSHPADARLQAEQFPGHRRRQRPRRRGRRHALRGAWGPTMGVAIAHLSKSPSGSPARARYGRTGEWSWPSRRARTKSLGSRNG